MESITPGLSVLLISVGLLLVCADLFFRSGILVLLALVAIGAGIGLPFYYGDTATGVITLVGTLLLLTGASAWIRHYWPRSALGRRMVLTGPEDDFTVASMPVLVELEQLRGRVGTALSALRPSGTADFDGRRIDVLTEGLMVEPGQKVRCIDVRAGKVVVRPLDDGPKPSELENLDLT